MASELFPAGAPDVLYVVDMSSYVLRAYHAIAPLTSPSGEPTHAVHGTVAMLERLLRERRPALFAIAMDSGRATFRSKIYPQYKANRPPAPEDLKQQLRRCEEIVRAFNVAIWKCDGVEADDLIATGVQQARAQGLRVVIVAADKDLMQLVSPEVVMYDTMRERVFGVPEVEERFGVSVAQVGDVLALTGDTSDNVPGVPSVGPKTAKELLVAYGDLAGIYQNLDKITRKALREALTNNKEQAFLSRELVKLKADCELEVTRESLSRPARDIKKLGAIYAELGFQRLQQALAGEAAAPSSGSSALASAVARPESKPVAEPVVTAIDYRLVREASELVALVNEAEQRGRVAVELFCDVPSPTRGRLVGVAVATGAGVAHYVPLVQHGLAAPKPIAPDAARAELNRLFSSVKIKKSGFDVKRNAVIAKNADYDFVGGGFDASLAAYLLDPEQRNDQKTLFQRELGLVTTGYDELTKRARGQTLRFDEVPIEEALAYAASCADHVLRLEERLTERLGEEGLGDVYQKIELPLSPVLAEMEVRGVLVDTSVLSALGRDCDRELIRLEAEAHKIAGRDFNVNSPRQLETLLFDELGLKPLKRTKTSRSTDAATLEALSDQHPLPAVVLEIRQLSKLKGTYIEALPLLVSARTGRIHTSWEQAVAATGRLSSTDPNLQNIPIRTELGRKIRAAFVAPEGYAIVSADYSQIELRVLAHLSQDPVLLDAYRTGQDIHTRTAMEIFELDASQVTREHRTRAKAVNFGIIYGQGDSGLAKVLGIPRAEAGSFIAAYFRRLEGVRRFMNQTLDEARQGQAVKSLLGRRRLLPNISSANRAERLAAERIAMNMPIQGTAADILKLAMLACAEPVTKGARMVLSVHDELVFEVPVGEVEEAKVEIRRRMQGVYELDVPLVVDVGAGKDWNSAH
jgi:DNA polymerase-1